MHTRVLQAVFLVLLLASSPIGLGCSVLEPISDETHFGKATAVFLARVVRTEARAKPERWGSQDVLVVEGTYKLVEVFKGQPKDEDIVLDLVFGPGNCSLGLMAGLHYLFFIYGDDRFVLWPRGSRGYVNLEGTKVKPELEKFRALARQHAK